MAHRKGTDGGAQERGVVRNFDLNPIDTEYELDPTWTSADSYGNGLKRYIHKATGMPRAVLTVRKDAIPKDVSQAEVKKQLETLCKIDHVNIVQFREALEDRHHIKLVYDWCQGGCLVTQLQQYEDVLTEGHVAQIMREVLSALAAAQAFGIHHCDLGLFSIFLGFHDRLSPIKIFGVGLAGFLIPTLANRKESRTNKHFYAALEMFWGRFKILNPMQRHLSDVWSVGAILFTICSGRPPFGMGSKKHVMGKIELGAWTFGLEFSQYSTMLREFIEAMLIMPWQKRKSATEILRLSWMSKSQTIHIQGGKIASFAMQQLNTFVAQDHVKQTLARLLTDIGISDELYPKLEAQFRELDLNGDGTITLGELMEVAGKIPGMTREGVDQMIAKLDRNGNCTVDISEFIAALILEQDEADEQLIQKAFCRMDCNGDARVTKTELFGVLRTYSTTIDVQEISEFIAQNDKNGDQKMDYREFCTLFPQVADKYKDLKKRMSDSRLTIESAPNGLKGYQEVSSKWLKKVIKMRDVIEIGCEVQQLPDNHTSTHYSYEKGHYTEWDVQTMITDCIEMLTEIPGYQLTSFMKKMQKNEKEKKATRMSSLKDSSILGARALIKNQQSLKAETEARLQAQEGSSSGSESDAGEPAEKAKGSGKGSFQGMSSSLGPSASQSQSVAGAALLGAAASQSASKLDQSQIASQSASFNNQGVAKDGGNQVAAVEASEDKDEGKDGAKAGDGKDAGKDGHHHHHHHHHKKKNKEGLANWESKVLEDRKERMMDPEYQADNRINEILYWLVKVKSDMRWLQPLKEVIADMRESCIEEVQHCPISKKTDLFRMIAGLNEKYVIKDGFEVMTEAGKVKIGKMARLLPLGVMKGKDLASTHHMGKMEDIALPAEFVFGHQKGECTRQKVWFQHHRHSQGMMAAGAHLTAVIESLEQLFAEVAEDITMSGSLEGLMPFPPNLSQLFLPFCEGREVADDAATPRTDGSGELLSDDEEGMSKSFGATRSGSITGMASFKSSASFGDDAGGVGTGKAHKTEKIERNQVLTLAANYARAASQEKKKNEAAEAKKTGTPENKPLGKSASMGGKKNASSFFNSAQFNLAGSVANLFK